MRKAIKSVDDLKAGYLQLMEDFMFERIPRDVRLGLVNLSLSIGSEAAQKIAQEAKADDPLLIARQLGVEVNWTSRDNLMGTLLVRSEYYPPASIRIYEKSITQLKTAVEKLELEDLFPPQKMDTLHIAHELFHHIEKTRIGVLSEAYPVETLRWGPIRLKSQIRALSEIGAGTFSKNLVGAKVSPKLLDYLISADKARELPYKLKELEAMPGPFLYSS